MDATLLDTDILSEILKQRDREVLAKAAAYLDQYGQFTFSAFTRYEVRRGLLERQATTQLERFEEFCEHSLVLPVSDDVLSGASVLWASARAQGRTTGDADLIVAATAMCHNLVLVTGNLRHFDWISNLVLADWRVS